MAGEAPGDAWWVLFSSLFLVLSGGTIYAFGEFSPLFKQEDHGYKLGQEQVTLLALMATIGNYLVVDAGLLVSKVGSTFTLCCGTCLTAAGYFALWLALAVYPGECPFGALLFFCFVYGHGTGFLGMAVVGELLQCFPDFKGNAIGCVKAFYGLATAIFAVANHAIFAPSRDTFLLFVSVYSLAAGLIFIPVLHMKRAVLEVSARRAPHLFKFRLMTVGLVIAVFIVLVVSLLTPQFDDMKGRAEAIFWKSVLVAMILGLCCTFFVTRSCEKPCCIKVPTEEVGPAAVPGLVHIVDGPDVSSPSASGLPAGRRGGGPDAASAPLSQPLPSSCEEAETSCDDAAVASLPPVDMSGKEMLQAVDFWIMSLALAIGQGCALEIMHEAAQIVPAIEGQPTASTGFVAMTSCLNSLGRLSFGNGSEALRAHVSRTAFLTLGTGMVAVSHALLAFMPSRPVLWIAGALASLAYGGLWGVQPVIVMEVFGPTDIAFKYACGAFAGGVGFWIFGTLVAGRLYDKVADQRGEAPHCYDPECFNLAFTISFAASILAILCCIFMSKRTRRVYDQLRLRPT